jgi:hypothetical protein
MTRIRLRSGQHLNPILVISLTFISILIVARFIVAVILVLVAVDNGNSMNLIACHRKPVDVQAVRVPPVPDPDDCTTWQDIADWCDGRIVPAREFPVKTEAFILIGSQNRVPAFTGDWIVKSKSGEFYTVPPLLFAETYEVVSPPVYINVTAGETSVKRGLGYLDPCSSGWIVEKP